MTQQNLSQSQGDFGEFFAFEFMGLVHFWADGKEGLELRSLPQQRISNNARLDSHEKSARE